jgi:putative transposase
VKITVSILSGEDHDQELLKKITEEYWESEGRYGSPRIFRALKAKGIAVGEKRVARLMKA